MARPVFNETHAAGLRCVTFLSEAELEGCLPLGTEVQVAPIWMCNDFFDLRRLFADVDGDDTGALDLAEARTLIRREVASAADVDGVEDEAERVIAAADAVGRGERPAITLDAFRATCFYRARMCARIEQLGERAAARVENMHSGAPWNGELPPGAESYEALVNGTCLGATSRPIEGKMG